MADVTVTDVEVPAWIGDGEALRVPTVGAAEAVSTANRAKANPIDEAM